MQCWNARRAKATSVGLPRSLALFSSASRKRLLSALPVAVSTRRGLRISCRSLEIPSLHFSARCMPQSDSGVVYCSNSGPTGPVICRSSYINLREPDFCEVGCIKLSLAQPARHLEQLEGDHQQRKHPDRRSHRHRGRGGWSGSLLAGRLRSTVPRIGAPVS